MINKFRGVAPLGSSRHVPTHFSVKKKKIIFAQNNVVFIYHIKFKIIYIPSDMFPKFICLKLKKKNSANMSSVN
jgi:hypothetical protein